MKFCNRRQLMKAGIAGLGILVLGSCSKPDPKEEPLVFENDQERQAIEEYRAKGRPYLFENADDLEKEIEKEYIDKGWDTKHLSDRQVLQIIRETRSSIIRLLR
jgi:hypothetical protein